MPSLFTSKFIPWDRLPVIEPLMFTAVLNELAQFVSREKKIAGGAREKSV
jgi:hypothetical protein